jgi:protease IV
MRLIQNIFLLPFRLFKFLYLFFRVGRKTKGSLYLEIPSSFSVSKKSPILELFSGEKEIPLYIDFLKDLTRIRDSKIIETVSVLCDKIDYGFSEIQEIGNLLKEIKNTGKTVKGFSLTGDIKTLYLLSFIEERYTIETGEFLFFLPAVESFFWGKFLKNWGIEVEAYTSGKYKSFAEPFQKDKFSPEAKENLTNLIRSWKEQILNNLKENTGIDWVKIQRPMMSSEYLKSVGYFQEFMDEDDFKKQNSTPQGTNSDNITNLSKDYSTTLIKKRYKYDNFQFFPSKKDYIAILPLKGNINLGNRKESEMKEGSIHAYPVIEILRSLEEREEIKAIILEIDSGGGSAFGSELIYRELQKLGKKKKIYSYFQNISASGGYYIGCGTERIGSSPFCITGSIGTVSVRPNLKGFYDKFNITKDRIEHYPGREIFSEYGKLTEYSKKFLANEIERVKNQFYKIVCKSRNIDPKDLEPRAGGRVFTGKDFLKMGMLDSNDGYLEFIHGIEKEMSLKNVEWDYLIPIYNLRSMAKNFRFASQFIQDPISTFKKKSEKSLIEYSCPYTEILIDSLTME